jgi:uncharacterized protein (TIGR02118 family)
MMIIEGRKVNPLRREPARLPVMIKQVTVLARGDDLTPEGFRAHWSTRHAHLVARLPGLVRYVQNDVRQIVPRSHLAPLALAIDGIEELWFASEKSVTGPAALHEERGFLRGKSIFTVRETIVYDTADASMPRHKRISALRRNPSMSVAEFQAYWSTVHLGLARALHHADRYAQNHVVEAHRRPELPQELPDIDGFGEFLTTDLARMQASYDTDAGRALNQDSKRFLGAVSTFVVEAREIPLQVAALGARKSMVLEGGR